LNLLAHLLLSGPEADVDRRLGNVLGDLVKGSVEGERPDLALPPGVLEGVRLHRRIDAFTDAHPVPRRSRRLIAPEWRRFSGILVDIYYDHVLTRNWPRFCPRPLADYLDTAYAQFRAYDPGQLPPEFSLVIRRMIQGHWLGSYGTREGIALTLRRVSRRLHRVLPLEEAADQLPEIYPALERDFLEFWPELETQVNSPRREG
jgi:acyl carrier protein phosphodiesterase